MQYGTVKLRVEKIWQTNIMGQALYKRSVQEVLSNREQRKLTPARLSDEDLLLIVWGGYKGWSITKIAEKIPASRMTVWKYQRSWEDDPALLLELPILTQMADSKFRCELCGESRPTKTKIYRHVLAHVVPIEIARYPPLNGYKRL